MRNSIFDIIVKALIAVSLTIGSIALIATCSNLENSREKVEQLEYKQKIEQRENLLNELEIERQNKTIAILKDSIDNIYIK